MIGLNTVVAMLKTLKLIIFLLFAKKKQQGWLNFFKNKTAI